MHTLSHIQQRSERERENGFLNEGQSKSSKFDFKQTNLLTSFQTMLTQKFATHNSQNDKNLMKNKHILNGIA